MRKQDTYSNKAYKKEIEQFEQYKPSMGQNQNIDVPTRNCATKYSEKTKFSSHSSDLDQVDSLCECIFSVLNSCFNAC
jgi:hypothetical protein